MEKKKLILIGGGGHCKSCIDVIEKTQKYEILGILDRPELVGTKLLDYSIIGTDDDILKYIQLGCHFLITVGQIKTANLREQIFNTLKGMDATLATIVSPSSIVSKYAIIGEGTIVMHRSTLNTSAVVGENCILNTACVVEHDVIIGNHTHISTNSVVNGDCRIGNEVFLGSNSVVSNQILIMDRVVIGAGTVVNKNLVDEGIYVGNPVHRINK